MGGGESNTDETGRGEGGERTNKQKKSSLPPIVFFILFVAVSQLLACVWKKVGVGGVEEEEGEKAPWEDASWALLRHLFFLTRNHNFFFLKILATMFNPCLC